MRLLRRYPLVTNRFLGDAHRSAHFFAERMEGLEALTDPKRHQVTAHSVLVDGLRFDALRTTGHRVRFADHAHVGVIVACRGTLLIDDGRGTTAVRGDDAAVWRPGARTTSIPGPYTGLGLRIPLARITAHAACNPDDGWCPDRPFPVRPTPRFVRALRHVVRELDAPEELDLASGAARGMARLLLDLLIDEFANVAPPARGRISTAGLSQVRRAEATLRDRFQDPVSIVAVAGELGVSTRSLQIGFQRHRGITPREFLASCRLEAARERLGKAKPGETVATIAYECGLMHLGRFAASYRTRYGEPPSATLARAQRRT